MTTPIKKGVVKLRPLLSSPFGFVNMNREHEHERERECRCRLPYYSDIPVHVRVHVHEGKISGRGLRYQGVVRVWSQDGGS